MIGELFTFLTNGIFSILTMFIGFLPAAHFDLSEYIDPGSLPFQVIGFVNYFLPVSEMLGILSIWAVAMALYQVFKFFIPFFSKSLKVGS